MIAALLFAGCLAVAFLPLFAWMVETSREDLRLADLMAESLKIRRSLDSEENRRFWRNVDAAKAKVRTWPAWKRGISVLDPQHPDYRAPGPDPSPPARAGSGLGAGAGPYRTNAKPAGHACAGCPWCGA